MSGKLFWMSRSSHALCVLQAQGEGSAERNTEPQTPQVLRRLLMGFLELPRDLMWAWHPRREKLQHHPGDSVLQTKLELAQRTTKAQNMAWICWKDHTLALTLGEFGSISSPWALFVEKNLAKAKAGWWNCCYSCLTHGLWLAQCPPSPLQSHSK